MGKQIKIHQPGRSIWSIGRWFCLTALVLSLMLQGCVAPPAEAPPEPEAEEVVVEEGETESEEVDEDAAEEGEGEEASAAEEPPWCDPGDDLYAKLPPIGDAAAEGISVEICVQGGAGYTLEIYEGTYDEIEYAKGFASPFEIYALITYFKVMDGDAVIQSFDPPLLMRISYTTAAWTEILTREDAGPRVAFLEDASGIWNEPWIEFVDEIYQTIEPDLEDSESIGVIEIIIEEIPDPLIGGC